MNTIEQDIELAVHILGEHQMMRGSAYLDSGSVMYRCTAGCQVSIPDNLIDRINRTFDEHQAFHLSYAGLRSTNDRYADETILADLIGDHQWDGEDAAPYRDGNSHRDVHHCDLYCPVDPDPADPTETHNLFLRHTAAEIVSAGFATDTALGRDNQ